MKSNEEDKDHATIPKSLPIYSLFRYSSCKDKFLIVFGLLNAAAGGLINPASVIALSSAVNVLASYQVSRETGVASSSSICGRNNLTHGNSSEPLMHVPTTEEFYSELQFVVVFMAVIAVVGLVTNYLMVLCLMISADNQAVTIRSKLFRSVLRQDISWFDTSPPENFSGHITADLDKILDGMGEKLGVAISSLSSTFPSLVIAFVYGWKLTLMVLSVPVLFTLVITAVKKLHSRMSATESDPYDKAGSVVEEALSSIKTVVAFGGEEKEIARYGKNLADARKKGITTSFFTSLIRGLEFMEVLFQFAIAFWYGSKLINDSCHDHTQENSLGSITAVTYAIVYFGLTFRVLAVQLEVISLARGAAPYIFSIIERVPAIDSSSTDGETPACVDGMIEFRNVHFSYPARKDVSVLQGLSFKVTKGETVALVGPSGGGKSTIIQLLQRFYDPVEGQILLDGLDIRKLNVGWLRNQTGIVKQEPTLFATSITENIRYGCPKATMKEIKQAAEDANVHNFITTLPKNYETDVGSLGAQLSGGEKQRIAIARALVRKPRILLLDEATSALDTESEAMVQQALDTASKGRTTIVIAHRLSTIRNADRIFIIAGGRIQECGTHKDLMAKKHLYYSMARLQKFNVQITDSVAVEAKPPQHPPVENELSQSTRHTVLSRSLSCRQNSILMSLRSVSVNLEVDQQDDEDLSSLSTKRVFQMMRPEWRYLFIGMLCSALEGVLLISSGIMTGYAIEALAIPDSAEMLYHAQILGIIFLGTGIVSGVVSFLVTLMFSIAGENFTARIRKLVFGTVLKQVGSFQIFTRSCIATIFILC